MPEAPRSPHENVCPICGKPVVHGYRRLLARCADVDLNRWLSGVYVVPVTDGEEEDERCDTSSDGVD